MLNNGNPLSVVSVEKVIGNRKPCLAICCLENILIQTIPMVKQPCGHFTNTDDEIHSLT